MIKIENICKSYGNNLILRNINFEIKETSLTVILGLSGIGKSVLLRLISVLEKPQKGKVFLFGENMVDKREKHLLEIRKRIGYVFQENSLYDFMTVFENIAFPLYEHTDLNENQIIKKISVILRKLDLKGIEDKYPRDLSGGMKKRVGLARAIILGNKILLCDEPTSGLDPIRSNNIMKLIKTITEEFQMVTIITSHDLSNTLKFADRILLLNDKKIFDFSSTKSFLQSKELIVKEYLEGIYVHQES